MTLKTTGKILVLLAAVLIASGTALASSTPRKSEGGVQPLVTAGSDPVMFKLEKLGGGQVDLKDDLKNKAVILVFWSLFCGPCQEELPVVDQLYKKLASKDVVVYAINLDGEKRGKAVEKYMEKQGFKFTVLWEVIDGITYVTADAYGVPGTPTTILIGKKGKVSYTHVGQESFENLEKAVNEALAEK